MKNLRKSIFSLFTAAMLVISTSCGGDSNDDLQESLKPTILSFTPISGLIGSEINISGSNFSQIANENIVEINGVDLEVISASATSLTVVIPDEAETGAISITVNDETSVTSSDFEVITSNQFIINDPSVVAFYEFNGNLQDELGTYDGSGNFERYDEDRNGVDNSAGFYGFTNNGFVSGFASANFGEVPLSGGAYSLSFWIKVRSSSIVEGNGYRLLSKRETCMNGNFFDIQFSTSVENPNRLGFEIRNDENGLGNSAGIGANNLSTDKWAHVVLIIDSSNRKTSVFFDGVLATENADWIANDQIITFPDNAPFGASISPCINSSNIRGFEGLLDAVVLFNKVLSENEIKTLALK